jgi:hypothetical protein
MAYDSVMINTIKESGKLLVVDIVSDADATYN